VLGRLADVLGRLADGLGRLADGLGRLGDEVGRLMEGERLAEAPPPPRLPPPPPLRPPPPRAKLSVPINIESMRTKTLNQDRRIIKLRKFDKGKDIQTPAIIKQNFGSAKHDFETESRFSKPTQGTDTFNVTDTLNGTDTFNFTDVSQ